VDKCPLDPEDKDDFEDENGCPDPDNDQDGILDATDQCPLDPEDKDGFEDENGCPDPDNDKDGILDTVDKCPLEPEVINGIDDDDGCPDEGKSAVQVTQEKIEILERVYFDLNKAVIKRRSFNVLNQVASILKANPQITKVRVEGHTDHFASDRINKPLSQRRANAVRYYLVKRGVYHARLEAVGFGSERPLVPHKQPDSPAKNRRVEFVITEQGGESAVRGSEAAEPPATAPVE
jgi:outer membrane protein OmpA-like peptidoglycan-associated protein